MVKDFLTNDEVAELTGLKYDTLYTYRRRNIFPEPDIYIGRTPVWSRATIEKWLKNRIKKWPSSAKEKLYSDEALLGILQGAHKKVQGPLTTIKYNKLKILPTIATYISRFGSWKKACKIAGVPHGKAPKRKYSREHSKDEMLEAVAKYMADPRTTGSAQGYEDWQKDKKFAPSLSVIRQRIGTWNEIKELVIKRQL